MRPLLRKYPLILSLRFMKGTNVYVDIFNLYDCEFKVGKVSLEFHN